MRSPEYDPTNRLITLYGPLHAYLAALALNVSYANDPKLLTPDYSLALTTQAIGSVIELVDQQYIEDLTNQYHHPELRSFSDWLFDVRIADLHMTKRAHILSANGKNKKEVWKQLSRA